MKLKIISIVFLNLFVITNIAFANVWLDKEKFTGLWESYRMFNNRFRLARVIQIELWITGKGELEGAAMFIKKKEHCLGKLKLDPEKGQLIFTPMEGSLKQDIGKGAFGIYKLYQQKDRIGLYFEPTAKKNSRYIKDYSSVYYQKVPILSKAMSDFTHRLKKRDKQIYQAKDERIINQRKNIKMANDSINGPHRFNFSDAKLIGSWHGKFINREQTYPAELMFWSSKPYRYTQVVGIVKFGNVQFNGKALHTTGIVTDKTDNGVRILINMANLKSSMHKSRKRVNGNGYIALHEDDNSMTIFLNSELTRHPGYSHRTCFTSIELPDNRDPVHAIGMFQRGSASEELKTSLKQIAWNSVKAPTAQQQQVLLGDTSRLEELKRAHARALVENEQTRNQIQAEKVAAERKKAQREQQRRAELERKREAEYYGRAKTPRTFGSPSRPTPPNTAPLPVVHGPFDSLHGGSFLNALYKGDWSAIEKFNSAYANRKIQQNASFWGNKPHWSDDYLNAGFKSIKLTNSVLAIYLFNYDTAYGACLKKDAVRFEVVEVVPDTVYYNYLGYEVARDYGYTSRKYFKVNKEFEDAFRRVGRMKPEGTMLAISDFLLNQGGTDLRRELVKGTKELMAKYRCDSPEIKQLEQNLIKTVR